MTRVADDSNIDEQASSTDNLEYNIVTSDCDSSPLITPTASQSKSSESHLKSSQHNNEGFKNIPQNCFPSKLKNITETFECHDDDDNNGDLQYLTSDCDSTSLLVSPTDVPPKSEEPHLGLTTKHGNDDFQNGPHSTPFTLMNNNTIIRDRSIDPSDIQTEKKNNTSRMSDRFYTTPKHSNLSETTNFEPLQQQQQQQGITSQRPSNNNDKSNSKNLQSRLDVLQQKWTAQKISTSIKEKSSASKLSLESDSYNLSTSLHKNATPSQQKRHRQLISQRFFIDSPLLQQHPKMTLAQQMPNNTELPKVIHVHSSRNNILDCQDDSHTATTDRSSIKSKPIPNPRRLTFPSESVASSTIDNSKKAPLHAEDVFDRLYKNAARKRVHVTIPQDKKEKYTASLGRSQKSKTSKVKGSARRKSRSSLSIGESTVSSLSCSESIFDRLHKNEKRPRVNLTARKISSISGTSVGSKTKFSDMSTIMSKQKVNHLLEARAKLERRLAYDPASSNIRSRLETKTDPKKSVYERLYPSGQGGKKKLNKKQDNTPKGLEITVPSSQSIGDSSEKIIKRQVPKKKSRKISNDLSVFQHQAKIIQAAWWMYFYRSWFNQKKCAIIVIQKYVRKLLARQNFRQKRRAIKQIQRWFKNISAKKDARQLFDYEWTQIQENFSSYSEDSVEICNAFSICIQRAWRGWKCRVDHHKQVHSAIVIQTLIRKLIAMEQYKRLIQSQRSSDSIPLQKVAVSPNINKSLKTIQQLSSPPQLHYQPQRIVLEMSSKDVEAKYSFKNDSNIREITSMFQCNNVSSTSTSDGTISSNSSISKNVAMNLFRDEEPFTIPNEKSIQESMHDNEKNLMHSLAICPHYSASIIQKCYNLYRSRLVRTTKLIRNWRMQSSFKGFDTHSRMKLMKVALFALELASKGKAPIKNITCLRIGKRHITLRWQKVFRLFCDEEGTETSLRHSLTIESITSTKLLSIKLPEKELATIILKATLKSALQREEETVAYIAATEIQSLTRMYMAISKYNLRTVTKSYRKNFALIKIQSIARMYIAHKHYAKTLGKVKCVQCYIRSRSVRRHISKMDFNASTIQKFWQNYSNRMQFRQKLRATIMIQALHRKRVAMSKYHVAMKSIQILENFFRHSLYRKQIREKTDSALVLQRAWKKQKKLKKEKSKRNCSIVLIQSMIRMYLSRSMLLTIRSSVLIIQRNWRGLRARKDILNQHNHAKIFQTYYRRYVCVKQYQLFLESTLVLQKVARGMSCRRMMQSECDAAILIQKTYRGFISRSLLMKAVASITVMQSYVRGYFCRTVYHNQIHSAIIIQCMYRLTQARGYLATSREAAVSIQTRWRCRSQLSKYKTLVSSVVRIQSYYRKYAAIENYKLVLYGVKRLQSMYRGAQVRAEVARDKAEEENRWTSALVVQKCYRRYVCVKQYQLFLESTLVLQKVARGMSCKKKFDNVQSSTKMMQKLWRGYKTRAIVKNGSLNYIMMSVNIPAATQIQNFWRYKTAEAIYKSMVTSAVMIQSFIRCYLVRKQYSMKLYAVKLIQVTFISWKGINRLKHVRKAAILLQKYIRGYLVRSNMHTFVLSKSLSFYSGENFTDKIILLQSFFRMAAVRNRFSYEINAIATIQRLCRRYICRNREREKIALYRKQTSAIVIQCYARRVLSLRLSLLKQSCIVIIQKYYRKYHAISMYEKKLLGISVIQKYTRCILAKKLFSRHKNAVIKIQSFFRMNNDRMAFCRLLNNIVKVQSFVRVNFAMSMYRKSRISAHVIQSWMRGSLARISFNKTKSSTLILQKCVRNFPQRKRSLKQYNSAIKIQATFRRDLSEKKYLFQRSKILQLQSWVRCRQCISSFRKITLSVKMIQSMMRLCLVTRQLQIKNHAAKLIQELWRLKLGRLKFTRLQQAAILAKQIKIRNAKMQQVKKMCSIEEEKRIIAISTRNAERWIYSKTDKFDSFTRGFHDLMTDAISSFECSTDELCVIKKLENNIANNPLISPIQIGKTTMRSNVHKSPTKSIRDKQNGTLEVSKQVNSIESLRKSDKIDVEKCVDNKIGMSDFKSKSTTNLEEEPPKVSMIRNFISKEFKPKNKRTNQVKLSVDAKMDSSQNLKIPAKMKESVLIKPKPTNVHNASVENAKSISTTMSSAALDAQKLILEARRMRDARKVNNKPVSTDPVKAVFVIDGKKTPQSKSSATSPKIPTAKTADTEINENTQVDKNGSKQSNDWDWMGSW